MNEKIIEVNVTSAGLEVIIGVIALEVDTSFLGQKYARMLDAPFPIPFYENLIWNKMPEFIWGRSGFLIVEYLGSSQFKITAWKKGVDPVEVIVTLDQWYDFCDEAAKLLQGREVVINCELTDDDLGII